MNPFFSIIVVSFNPGDRLRTTLQSIREQSFADYEVIVKDGKSSDGSLASIPEDARIRVISGRDCGIYDAMNEAVRRAEGEYLYFLNCGDHLYDREVLRRVHDAIVRRKERPAPQLFYGDIYERLTGQIAAASPVMDDFACYRNLPCHQACFYSRALFADRGFDTDLRVRADYEHFLYCRYRAGAELTALPMVIADYEGGGFSETRENRRLSAKEHRLVTALYLPLRSRILFRLYMIFTLQPLREKFSRGKYTAALYHGLKNRLYRRGTSDGNI
ncbi:glycosyltransferase [Lachnoclostridium sp. Marseille-P6806]|uniref:glycosyltransferase n=1 Tax=Lachnoclostridium sp. Marseille-P6806 TaxID=2364793 RepID=UPI001F5F60D5|nr:glycosyltransferase [Lachnoclostridium sp. Marseille-P6806]